MNTGKAQDFDAKTWVDGLYRQYSDMIMGRVRFRLGTNGASVAAAEDVVIEVFETALIKVAEILRRGNAIGWLKKTADNLCSNECRRQQAARNRELPLMDDVMGQVVGGLAQGDEALVQRITIGEIQTLLKPEEKALFNRLYIQMMPLQDVSDECEISYGTAKVRAYRLRQRLQEISRQYS